MFQDLVSLHQRPPPFSRYTADVLWTDDHISRGMLAAHLDTDSDVASRRPQAIDGIVGWIDREVGLVGKTICDLGCGPGLYATRMAARGASVVGTDFSQRSIAYARDAADEAGLKIDYRRQDYLAGGLPDQQDLICLIYGDLCALSPEQRSGLLARIRDALKPGGAFICDVFSGGQYAERTETVTYGRRFMNGFWASGDYFGFLNTFLYDDLRLALDRYLIVEPQRMREVFNWLQYFDPGELSAELADAGFAIEKVVDAVSGDRWREAPREFAVIAKRS